MGREVVFFGLVCIFFIGIHPFPLQENYHGFVVQQSFEHAYYVSQLEKHQQKGDIQPNVLYVLISEYN
jgi:hypothetical protein